ncbi:cysteine peptidase family C39 domain-containing protein [Pseudomonas sp. NPDC089408]|uniref:cysteine peptidase family C39 domain-containing protein n=1 Tax=Pseudomonas sp. NPDC089408 TaxID=3364465 RepID=UPI00380A5143
MVQILADIVYRLSKDEEIERMHEGFSMLDLKQSAQRLGYSAAGVMLPIEAASQLKGPVIILLRPNNTKLHHFVVLKGVSGGHAFLADPARGHLRMPLFELAAQWRGETLILGRDGFGLPLQHALTPPRGNAVAPEQQVTRALQRVPPP